MTITLYRHRLVQFLLAKRRKSEGFTLVELLIVVVILGVLGAVGIPAYLNQVDIARENAANQAVMAAAKACSALRVTGEVDAFEPVSGVVEEDCAATDEQLYTSDGSDGSEFENLATQAVATVSPGGGVQLTTPASAE